MLRTLMIIIIAMLFVAANHANGDIIIDVQDATMTAGTSSFVDVWLTGDAGDTLEEFGYVFSISGVTPQSGDLQFSIVQFDSEVNEFGPTPYVFLNDSGGFNAVRLGGDPVVLTGGDILGVGQNRSVTGTFLLARLDLTHVGSLINPSHQFTISLTPGDSYFDMDADTLGVQPLTFTSFSGTITVNSAAAVPEPSTFALLGLFAAGGAIRSRWRNKKQRPSLV